MGPVVERNAGSIFLGVCPIPVNSGLFSARSLMAAPNVLGGNVNLEPFPNDSDNIPGALGLPMLPDYFIHARALGLEPLLLGLIGAQALGPPCRPGLVMIAHDALRFLVGSNLRDNCFSIGHQLIRCLDGPFPRQRNHGSSGFLPCTPGI